MDAMYTKISLNGRVVISAAFRQVVGLAIGDEVVLRVENGAIILALRAQQIQRAQALVRRYITLPKGALLSDELIAERRAEVKRG